MAKKRKPLPLPPSPDRRRFRQRLLAWYKRHGRDLPWRKTSDPYHILVSEIMLQQTQVDRVLPKYHEWLGKYPSLSALAAADEHDVAETWRPLGYNIRPRRLHAIAKQSVDRYGAVVEDLRQPLVLDPGHRLLRPSQPPPFAHAAMWSRYQSALSFGTRFCVG